MPCDGTGCNWVYLSCPGSTIGLEYLGDGIIYIARYPNQFFISFDYGETWILLSSIATIHHAISFESLGNNIFLAGFDARHYVYRSIDNCQSWTRATWPATTDPNAILSLNNSLSIIGGNNGAIYRSVNSGLSFSLQQTLGTDSILSLCYLGDGVCLAGTRNTGKLWKSLDYGASWSLMQTLGSINIETISNSASGVCICGTSPSGQLWKSVDNGSTWTLQSSLDNVVSIRKSACISDLVFIVGTVGPQIHGLSDILIWRSGDSGETWTLSDFYLRSWPWMPCLVFCTESLALASTFTNGFLYKTGTPFPPAPIANFLGVPLYGFSPLNVQFTDTSTNNPTSWLWDFGDDLFSLEQNPLHTYTTYGKYTVSLRATNAGGEDLEVKFEYITVLHPPDPDHTYSPLWSIPIGRL